MNVTHFFTDLDRTIIHSKNKGYRCVELSEDKEITYMTDYSYTQLLELLKDEKLNFIPCTMRNLNQTLRVGFIKEYKPKFIICTNGAQIYIDGKLDEEWNTYMKTIINSAEVNGELDIIKSLQLNPQDIRCTEDFYISMRFNDDLEATTAAKQLKNQRITTKKIQSIGRKVFVIDEKINKVFAVDYLMKKFNMTQVITAGDSYVDKDFTQRGVSILPNHCSFRHTNSHVTKEKGILSTDEILDCLRDLLD